MPLRTKKKKSSKLRTVGKVAAGVALAGGALIAGRAIAKRLKKGGGSRRKKSAAWYARAIARLKLKKRYDKLRLSV